MTPWMLFPFRVFCVVLLQNPNWVRSLFYIFLLSGRELSLLLLAGWLVSNLNNFSPAYFSTHYTALLAAQQHNFSPLCWRAALLLASFFLGLRYAAPLAWTDNATTLICVFRPPQTTTIIALRFFVVVVLRILREQTERTR